MAPKRKRLAEHVASYVKTAERLNRLVSGQNLAEAEALLDTADDAADAAYALAEGLSTRVNDLIEAKATTESLLVSLGETAAQLRRYLARPDVDRLVGEDPEHLLAEAQHVLNETERQRDTQDLPDWFALEAEAERAAALLTRASQTAKAEEEEMRAAESQTRVARQRAQEALHNAERYVRSRRSDVGHNARQGVQDATKAFRQGDAAYADAATAEELRLKDLLNKSLRHFASAKQRADNAYRKARSDVSSAESARALATMMASRSARRRSSSSGFGGTPGGGFGGGGSSSGSFGGGGSSGGGW